VSRLLVAQRALTVPGWAKDALWRRARAVPSLDLRFADNKSLTDAVTGASLVTFTRRSSGTYVGSDGVLRTAVTNLLLRSEDLTTTWTKDAGVTITADSSQGQPFSAAQVFRVNYTGANQAVNQSIAYLAAPYAASVWIKGTPGETIRFTGQTAVAAANFTLTGNWQRLSLTWTGTAASHSFTINTFNAVTARTIYVAAPQLEQSTTVGEYIPTTSTINSAPRFDHNPTTGESLGLLVEEQRTNLLLRSEEFDDAYWTKTGLTVTANATASPDSLTAADKFIATNTTNGNAALLISSSVSKAASAITYTFSCFAKAAEFSGVRLLVRDVASNANRTEGTVDLATLSQSSILAVGNFTNASFSVVPLLNGWYRLVLTFTTGTETSINARVTGIVSEVGNGTSGFFVWGAQLEAGSFPTSYIPTTTAAVTRSADVASITGSAFSGWYNSTAGTMRSQWVGAVNGCRPFYCEDAGATSTERFAQRIGSNFLRTEVTSNGVTTNRSASGAGTVTYPAIITSCAAYDATNCVVAFRGDVSSTATADGGPECGEMFIGSYRGTATFANGPIARLTYWPQLLPSSTLSVLAP
jgi:hypothetical protein